MQEEMLVSFGGCKGLYPWVCMFVAGRQEKTIRRITMTPYEVNERLYSYKDSRLALWVSGNAQDLVSEFLAPLFIEPGTILKKHTVEKMVDALLLAFPGGRDHFLLLRKTIGMNSEDRFDQIVNGAYGRDRLTAGNLLWTKEYLTELNTQLNAKAFIKARWKALEPTRIPWNHVEALWDRYAPNSNLREIHHEHLVPIGKAKAFLEKHMPLVGRIDGYQWRQADSRWSGPIDLLFSCGNQVYAVKVKSGKPDDLYANLSPSELRRFISLCREERFVATVMPISEAGDPLYQLDWGLFDAETLLQAGKLNAVSPPMLLTNALAPRSPYELKAIALSTLADKIRRQGVEILALDAIEGTMTISNGGERRKVLVFLGQNGQPTQPSGQTGFRVDIVPLSMEDIALYRGHPYRIAIRLLWKV